MSSSSSSTAIEKKKKVPLKNNQVARSITNSEFQDYKNQDSVIFFFKETCPFCRELKPTWNKVAKIIPSRWKNEQMSSSVSSDSPVKHNKPPRVCRMDMNKYDKVKRDIGFPTVPMIAMYKKHKPVVFITTKDRMCSNLLSIIENYYKGDTLPSDKSEYVIGTENGLWPHSKEKKKLPTPSESSESFKSEDSLSNSTSASGGQVSFSSLSPSLESSEDRDGEREKERDRQKEKEDREKERLRREAEKLKEEKEKLKRELRHQERKREEEEERRRRHQEKEKKREEEKKIMATTQQPVPVKEVVYVAAPSRASTIASRAQVAYDNSASNVTERKKSVIVPREELKIRELQSENEILKKKVTELENHIKWHQDQNKLLMDRLEKEQEQLKRVKQNSVSTARNVNPSSQQEQMLGRFLETLVRNKNKI